MIAPMGMRMSGPGEPDVIENTMETTAQHISSQIASHPMKTRGLFVFRHDRPARANDTLCVMAYKLISRNSTKKAVVVLLSQSVLITATNTPKISVNKNEKNAVINRFFLFKTGNKSQSAAVAKTLLTIAGAKMMAKSDPRKSK